MLIFLVNVMMLFLYEQGDINVCHFSGTISFQQKIHLATAEETLPIAKMVSSKAQIIQKNTQQMTKVGCKEMF